MCLACITGNANEPPPTTAPQPTPPKKEKNLGPLVSTLATPMLSLSSAEILRLIKDPSEKTVLSLDIPSEHHELITMSLYAEDSDTVLKMFWVAKVADATLRGMDDSGLKFLVEHDGESLIYTGGLSDDTKAELLEFSNLGSILEFIRQYREILFAKSVDGGSMEPSQDEESQRIISVFKTDQLPLPQRDNLQRPDTVPNPQDDDPNPPGDDQNLDVFPIPQQNPDIVPNPQDDDQNQNHGIDRLNGNEDNSQKGKDSIIGPHGGASNIGHSEMRI